MDHLKTLLFVALLSQVGCTSKSLPEYRVLQSLRVISLHIDSPEINYDGTTFTPSTLSLTPLISDLYGSGRSLSYSLQWCLDPGISLGATPQCTGNPTLTQVATGQTVSTTATFASPNYTGYLSSISVNLSAASTTAFSLISEKFLNSSLPEQYDGLALILVFNVYVTGSPSIGDTAFKRVVFSTTAKTKNANPTGLVVQDGTGTTISDLVNGAGYLAYLPTTAAETYSWMDSLGNLSSLTETLVSTWFLTGPEDPTCANDTSCTTDGLFGATRTNYGSYNYFTAPNTIPTNRGRVLVVVTRDNRGGNTSARYVFGTGP